LYQEHNKQLQNVYSNLKLATLEESMRKTEEKLDGRYKEGHERKKPK